MCEDDRVDAGDQENTSEPLMRRGDEHRGGRILANSAAMASGQVVVVLIGFIMTPVIISNVGIALFGAWGIFTTAAGYITVLDPGTSGIVARFGAMAHVRGDTKEMGRLTSLGLSAWVILGVAALPIALLGIPLLASHVHVAGTTTAQLEVFFWWGYALVIFTAMQAVLTGQLTAIGLIWIATVIDVSCRLFFAVVLVGGFWAGWGLWALIVASFAQGVVAFLATFIVSWRTSGFPIGNPAKLDRAVFREVRRFGGWAQVTAILNTLTYSTDPIVIGTMVSPGAAGVVNMSSRISRQITYFSTVPQATLPAMSAAQQAGEGPAGIARMSIRSNRISYLLATALATLVFGTAPVLLALWQGRFFPQADIAVCIVGGTMMASILGQTAGIGIYALGRVGYGVRARFAGFFVNLAATIALAIPYGMPGVLVGTLLATITTNGYLQVRVNQLLDLSFWRAVWSWLLPLIGTALPPIVIDRLLISAMPDSVVHQRGPALAAIAVLLVINYLLFVIGLRVSKFLKAEDVGYLRRSLPGPLRKLMRPGLIGVIVGREAAVGS
jgi:O-antigen/teichoic acid export membrane protein